MLTGHCLCGAVRYTVTGTPTRPGACHCGQCRRMSGHVWAAATVPDDGIEITGPVRWHASSRIARRGFCPTCGSFLFWKPADKPVTDFSLGSLDTPTGLHLEHHIFTAFKGDYYDIADGLPQDPSE